MAVIRLHYMLPLRIVVTRFHHTPLSRSHVTCVTYYCTKIFQYVQCKNSFKFFISYLKKDKFIYPKSYSPHFLSIENPPKKSQFRVNQIVFKLPLFNLQYVLRVGSNEKKSVYPYLQDFQKPQYLLSQVLRNFLSKWYHWYLPVVFENFTKFLFSVWLSFDSSQALKHIYFILVCFLFRKHSRFSSLHMFVPECIEYIKYIK